MSSLSIFDSLIHLSSRTHSATGGDVITRLAHTDVITEDVVRDIARQVLLALQHIHSRNVAYLDLKPQDIVFANANESTIKLVDFGNAQELPESGYLTSWNFGTPEYSAPEIVGGNRHVSTPADLWSLGVVVYTLLTGISPFLGRNDRETLQNVLNEANNVNYGPLEGIGVSQECKDFLRGLLLHSPAQRMTAGKALKHPWFELRDDTLSTNQIDSRCLHQYWRHSQVRIAREQVVHFDRRRPLSDALKHPQGLLYTPVTGSQLGHEAMLNALRKAMQNFPDGSPVPPRSDSRSPGDPFGRPDTPWSLADELNSAFFLHGNESSYQQGPETDVIQLKDPDYVTRIRSYQRITSDTSSSWRLKAERKLTSNKPAVKERRRMLDVADEEGTNAALVRFAALKRQWRMQHERHLAAMAAGHHRDGTDSAATVDAGEEGCAPFFREKLPGSTALQETKPFALRAIVIGTPTPNISWYHNELPLSGDGGRISVSSVPTSDGQLIMFIDKAWAGDAGEYKCVARNEFGEAITRAVVNMGSKFTATTKHQKTNRQVFQQIFAPFHSCSRCSSSAAADHDSTGRSYATLVPAAV